MLPVGLFGKDTALVRAQPGDLRAQPSRVGQRSPRAFRTTQTYRDEEPSR